MDRNKIFIFAGEQSGDFLGGHLVKILLENQYQCMGIGGEQMAKAGLESLIPFEEFQIMGFKQVILNLLKIFKQFRQVARLILENQVSTVLFIDYPGFSLRLAKILRKKGFQGKIIQYVCPSIWAWKKSRKQILEKYFDALFCLFSFEKELFLKSPLPTYFCGHLISNLNENRPNPSEIILFPGSRAKVIAKNLPIQIKAAKKLSKKLNLSIKISCARPSLEPVISAINQECIPVVNANYEKSNAAYAIATCGTIILELGLLKVPTVVTYKLSYLDTWVAKYLFKIRMPFYSLVNILLNQEVFPELIGPSITEDEIVKKILSIQDKMPLLDALKNKVYNKDHDKIFIEAIKSL
jgi:lipid-A-disaccharide synthase